MWKHGSEITELRCEDPSGRLPRSIRYTEVVIKHSGPPSQVCLCVLTLRILLIGMSVKVPAGATGAAAGAGAAGVGAAATACQRKWFNLHQN